MLHWRKNSGIFADKAERTLTLAVSQVVKFNVAKIHACLTQMFNVINPSWSHSLASEVANLKLVNIKYAAINQFYY